MTMLERVARAMFLRATEGRGNILKTAHNPCLVEEAFGDHPNWDGIGDAYRDITRAALAAMREPTVDVKFAGRSMIGRELVPNNGALVWNAMIDAILAEQP